MEPGGLASQGALAFKSSKETEERHREVERGLFEGDF